MATLDEVVQEVILTVPEVKGIQETVRDWVKRAIYDLDRMRSWRFLMKEREDSFSGGETAVTVDGLVEPFSFVLILPEKEIDLVKVHGRENLFSVLLGTEDREEPVLFSWVDQTISWFPKVAAESGWSWRGSFKMWSGDPEVANKWLTDWPDVVKTKTLIAAGEYLKSKELVEMFTQEFQQLLEEVR